MFGSAAAGKWLSPPVGRRVFGPIPRRHHRPGGDERRLAQRASCYRRSIRPDWPCRFCLTGLGYQPVSRASTKTSPALHKVEVVSGIVLILVGLLVMSGKSTLWTSGEVARRDSEPGRDIVSEVFRHNKRRRRDNGEGDPLPRLSFKTLQGSRSGYKNFGDKSCC
jgi:hypothetical protein